MSQFRLGLPGGVPVQVTVGGGASFVSVDDQNLTGVAGGTVLTPPGWATATSRFDIDATSGFSQLTVSRWSAAGSYAPGPGPRAWIGLESDESIRRCRQRR